MSVPFKVDLAGQVAVVTGGTGVLCSEMARALAECGAAVVVLGRRKDVAEALAEDIRKSGGKAMGVSADVLDRAKLEVAAAEIEAKFGPVDILLNGAGGNHPKGNTSVEYLDPAELGKKVEGITSFYELDQEGIQYVFNLNFLGTLLPCQVFTKPMVAKRQRRHPQRVVHVGHEATHQGPGLRRRQGRHCQLHPVAGRPLQPANVRVNALVPGFFLTDQNRNLLTKPEGGLTPRGEKIVAHTPMGRFGESHELVGALLWLVDNKSSGFVTGTAVIVDGGFSAFGGV